MLVELVSKLAATREVLALEQEQSRRVSGLYSPCAGCAADRVGSRTGGGEDSFANMRQAMALRTVTWRRFDMPAS